MSLEGINENYSIYYCIDDSQLFNKKGVDGTYFRGKILTIPIRMEDPLLIITGFLMQKISGWIIWS